MSSSSWYVCSYDMGATSYVEMLGDDAFTLCPELATAHRFDDKVEAMRIARRVAVKGCEVAVIPFDDVARAGPGPDRPAAHECVVSEWAIEPLVVAHVLCECDGRVLDELSTSDIDRYCRIGLLVLDGLKKAA